MLQSVPLLQSSSRQDDRHRLLCGVAGGEGGGGGRGGACRPFVVAWDQAVLLNQSRGCGGGLHATGVPWPLSKTQHCDGLVNAPLCVHGACLLTLVQGANACGAMHVRGMRADTASRHGLLVCVRLVGACPGITRPLWCVCVCGACANVSQELQKQSASCWLAPCCIGVLPCVYGPVVLGVAQFVAAALCASCRVAVALLLTRGCGCRGQGALTPRLDAPAILSLYSIRAALMWQGACVRARRTWAAGAKGGQLRQCTCSWCCRGALGVRPNQCVLHAPCAHAATSPPGAC
jgi:hypothetical protein